MTPQQQKENTRPGIRQIFRAVARLALACTVVYGGAGLALYSAWNGITFVKSYEGRAEHTFKDGSRRVVEGRGHSFTNPFTIADTTKWELQSQTAYFNSDRKERDRLDVDFSFSYVGPHSMTSYGKIDKASWAAGDQALKDIFRQNNWTSYAAVDPETQPQNAAAVCDAMSNAVRASLKDQPVEKLTVTECKIKVKVPFKGYTAKS